MEGRGPIEGRREIELRRGARTGGSDLGFLRIGLVILGFLMGVEVHAQGFDPPVPESAPGLSSEIEDALGCLSLQAEMQLRRDQLLERADSLGFAAELAGKGERAELLRRLESVKNRYADLGLDLLLRQEACRTLAQTALSDCDERIAALQVRVRSGVAGREDGATLRELLAARERLQIAETAPAVYEYPILETSAEDTRETLELKLQYYQEVASLLRALDERLANRISSARADFEALREAWRFVEDLAFTDMGDPGPGGDVLTQIQVPDGGTGSDGSSRPSSGLLLDRSDGEIEFALGPAPSDPEGAAAWIGLLEFRQEEVARLLEAMATQIGLIEERMAADPQ